MLVLNKTLDDPTIAELPFQSSKLMRQKGWRIDRFPARRYKHLNPSITWSVNWFPYPQQWAKLDTDLIHLHWIGGGLLPISAWAHLGRPVVWTLKDSWAFTGGCHIPHDCRRYEEHCGQCPILNSNSNWDLSRWTWRAKSHALSKMNPVIVTPSRWLAECARQSGLLHNSRIEIIPNPIDLEIYRPIPRDDARTRLELPLDKHLVAFGAVDALGDLNKGYDLLRDALPLCKQDVELLLFGASNAPAGLSRPAHVMGTIRDNSALALVFAAADALIMPSRSENLPNTIIEALAVGTPSIGFDIGGIPELIDHRENGYVAHHYDVADLARGIDWVLEDKERHIRLRIAARRKAEREYELTRIARHYRALFEDVLAQPY